MHHDDYARVERAIRWIEATFPERPTLAEVARHAGLSEFHFQRVFRRWAGLSPKQFLQVLTIEHAKQRLADSRSVLDAAFDVGLSGPSRLHDLFVTIEAMTPGEFKSAGAGLTIRTGVHDSPFGDAVIAITDRGVCGLAFAEPGGARAALDDLATAWPGAARRDDAAATRPYARAIFGGDARRGGAALPLHVRGTNFQVKVWEALLRVPSGCLTTYSDLASRIGEPSAARAVGAAVGANPVSFVIPCHRVIRSSGVLADYRWGTARKKAMAVWESAGAAGGSPAARPALSRR